MTTARTLEWVGWIRYMRDAKLAGLANWPESVRAAAEARRASLRFQTAEDFLLAYGRPLPWTLRPRSVRKRTDKRCYANALRLVLDQPDQYAYCEGLATSGWGPVEHAWCVGRDGLVVDPTWHEEPGEARAYFGVPFAAAYLAAAVVRQGRDGLLWGEPYSPLRRGTVEPETFLHPWFRVGAPVHAEEA